MKKLLFSLFAFFICIYVSGQDYNVPKNYKLENKESYKTYEPQIKETIDWLLQTPLGKDANKRQEANAFLMAWLTGTPDVHLKIDADFMMNFIKINPELVMPFTAGWTKYSLENDYSEDVVQGTKAGVETVITFYRKNRGYLKKDGNIEKYEKLMEKGKLETEINKKLNKK